MTLSTDNQAWLKSAAMVAVFIAGVWGGTSACAGSTGKTIVPEENKRASEERYGEQEMSMDELGQTPSERATVHHHRDTEPVQRDERED